MLWNEAQFWLIRGFSSILSQNFWRHFKICGANFVYLYITFQINLVHKRFTKIIFFARTFYSVFTLYQPWASACCNPYLGTGEHLNNFGFRSKNVKYAFFSFLSVVFNFHYFEFIVQVIIGPHWSNTIWPSRSLALQTSNCLVTSISMLTEGYSL